MTLLKYPHITVLNLFPMSVSTVHGSSESDETIRAFYHFIFRIPYYLSLSLSMQTDGGRTKSTPGWAAC